MIPRKDFAAAYLADGRVPVPIMLGAKGPTDPGWPGRAIDAAKRGDLSAFDGPGNVGVYLGEPSGWLVDVDIDCPEARPFADSFLPATLTFGRLSNPRSHRLYVARGAKHTTWTYQGKTLVEMRSGPNAHQTVFPGSVHPSGEAIEFVGAVVPPTVIDADELKRLVAIVAAGALLVRSWPHEGHGRHNAQRALAGGLLRAVSR